MKNLSDFKPWLPRIRIGYTNRYTRGPACNNDKGVPNRSVLSIIKDGKAEYWLHATKGIRRRYIPGENELTAWAFKMPPPKPAEAPRLAARTDHAAYVAGGERERARRLRQLSKSH